MIWLALLWPVAGWIGGAWVWTRTHDLRVSDAALMAVWGAALGPVLPLVWLVDEWSKGPPRPPVVLIKARNKESAS